MIGPRQLDGSAPGGPHAHPIRVDADACPALRQDHRGLEADPLGHRPRHHLIALVGGVDGILQAQAKADAAYFLAATKLPAEGAQASRVEAGVLKAYRWQYIVSGTLEPRFQHMLGELVSARQMARIQEALGPLAYAMPAQKEPATAH